MSFPAPGTASIFVDSIALSLQAKDAAGAPIADLGDAADSDKDPLTFDLPCTGPSVKLADINITGGTTPAPVTPAPVTPAPVTPAPVTPAPGYPGSRDPGSGYPGSGTPAPVTPTPGPSPRLRRLAPCELRLLDRGHRDPEGPHRGHDRRHRLG